MPKTIVIIAVTGNQGSSVADVFLKAGWTVKGVTRSPAQASAQALAAKGVEILKGDANDAISIKAAVQGADVVFGNTIFSDALSSPKSADLKYLKPGQTVREMCYELELQHGKNIADAVASVGGLEKYIWSSLSNATKWSKGEYKGSIISTPKPMWLITSTRLTRSWPRSCQSCRWGCSSQTGNGDNRLFRGKRFEIS